MEDIEIYRNCGCELSGVCDVCCTRVPRSISFLEGLKKVKTDNTSLRPLRRKEGSIKEYQDYIKQMLIDKGFKLQYK